MKIAVEQVYTSAGCNRMPEIVDWNSEGLICYGASNAVVIYNTNQKGKDPLTVYHHHASRVNSVKWLRRSQEPSTELVSCSADKTAAIWTLRNGNWEVTCKLTGHTDGITCIHGLYTRGENLVVYTGSIDSSVKVWERINGVVNLKQTISLNTGLCLTLHAHLMPIVNKPLLFCALDDHKIHVFASDEEYHKLHALAGHDDWVRGMDVIDVDKSTILLASASQDTYIRLWRIQQHIESQPTLEIRVEEKVFPAYGHNWSVKLEAVLAAHEGWVYGVQWHPYITDQEKKKKTPVYRLLSSSLDKTLIVWEPEAGGDRGEGGAWVERVRVGEVGGNGLGFYGSRFGPDGTSFLGHGYNGSFHIWKLCKESGQWQPVVVCGGHFGGVEDACWEPRGRYLLTAAADQTTRLHAPWTMPGGEVEWHEISRPQVHGYDLASLAPVDATTFVSAAEEKVIRVFRAPNNFLQNYKNIVGEELVDEATEHAAEGASVPSLGLSNKAVYSDEPDDDDGYFVPVNLTEPPTEETLMQNTLWPEAHKLYGHGYEVFTLAASPDATLVASACRATNAEHAATLLWETTKWEQIQKLVSHQLTVTQLSFSPDSQRLVSVSRDRRWTLFERRPNSNLFDIAACTDKTNGVHTRIIWCCAWAHDGSVFGTGSREGKVCLWSKSDTKSDTSLGDYALAGSPLEVNTSVTALAFAPLDVSTVLAVGLETGHITIYSYGDSWSLLRELDTSAAHHLAVRRLAFRPRTKGDRHMRRSLLASAAADHFVRIHAVLVTI